MKGNDYNELEFEEKRKQMVEEQIISRGIRDKGVLEAMLKVPRHKFVPEEYRAYSYNDGPLPIGKGQTISQPYIVALMTELLGVKEGDKVLEIGTGSGYQAAILAEVGCEVYTVEIIEELSERAKNIISSLGYKNVHFRVGDGYEGWPEHAPYDAIIVTASPPEIPKPLIEQLKEGGVMVTPVGTGHQKLQRIVKTSEGLEIEDIIPVAFVLMTGKAFKEL